MGDLLAARVHPRKSRAPRKPEGTDLTGSKKESCLGATADGDDFLLERETAFSIPRVPDQAAAATARSVFSVIAV